MHGTIPPYSVDIRTTSVAPGTQFCTPWSLSARVADGVSPCAGSLCVADFSFCLLVLPFEISRFANGQWLFGDGFVCVLFPLLRYWNVGCSLLSIAMVSRPQPSRRNRGVSAD